MNSSYLVGSDGRITCTRHAPQPVKEAIKAKPLAMAYDLGDSIYDRLTQQELEGFMNAGVTCRGCYEERQIDRIALTIKFGGKK